MKVQIELRDGRKRTYTDATLETTPQGYTIVRGKDNQQLLMVPSSDVKLAEVID